MKLIGIDLDGTLLNSNSEISKENVDALKSIINKKDYFVFICSGRPAFNIKGLLDEYGLNLPIVGTNGALGYDGDKVIFEYYFSHNTVLKIYDAVKDYPFLIYNKSKRFGQKKHLQQLEKLFKLSEKILTKDELKSFENYKKEILVKGFETYEDFYEIIDDEDFHVFKFFMYMPIPKIKKDIQKKLSNSKGIYCTESERTNIEIVPENVNKGIVFKHLEEYLGLDKSIRIAIGDSLNDLEMFKMANYGFAMKNSYDDIKALASHIVSSNDENGVAEAIEIIKGL